MRLLSHNTMRNNSKDAKGKGFPLRITATEVRVEESNTAANGGGGMTDAQKINFVKHILPRLDWPALVKGAAQLGIPTLPAVLSNDMAHNDDFLTALYHMLMHVHLVNGMLTCPVTGREFPVTDGIPNMMLEEDECEYVRF